MVEAESSINDRILSVLPLFYVGWSDSVLSPSEMKVINEVVGTMDFLTDGDKAYLRKWTDPKNPPPPEIFKEWIREIKSCASCLQHMEKSSLVDFCMKIGHAGVGTAGASEKTRAALEKLETELGIDLSLIHI